MAAAKGGARPGAGRKPGAVTKKTRKVAEEMAASGELTPLAFFLSILRTEPTAKMNELEKAQLFERRFEAAKAAAPLVHPRLSAVTSQSTVSGQLTIVSEFPG